MRLTWVTAWIAILPIVASAASAYASDAPQAPPITKLEARQLPPDEVKKRVLAELSDALSLQPYPSNGQAPHYPLTELWFTTKSYPTGLPGLCAADQIIVKFQPTAPPKGALTPTRAVGLQTGVTLYWFVRPPAEPGPAYVRDAELLAEASACTKFDASSRKPFSAEQPEYGYGGTFFWNKLEDGIKSGQPKYSVICPNIKGQICSEVLAELKNEEIDSVDSCTELKLGIDCVSITTNRFHKVDIHLGDGKIIDVSISQVVVIADMKRD